MNVYINGAFTSPVFYDEIRGKMKELGHDTLKICVYGDWKDEEMNEWDHVCEMNILEQKQIQHATHESIHLALTNDLVEDMMQDHYGLNRIQMFMIVTSDINFTNLVFKTQKYGKKLYIQIPKFVEEQECQMFNMSELEKKVHTVFEDNNEGFLVTKPIPLYAFLKKFSAIHEQNITDFDLEILKKQSIVTTYQSDGVFFIQYLEKI